MNYYTSLLTSQAHVLRLPDRSKDDIERFVLQHQTQHQKGGSVTLEMTPFRRQLDFWAFAIASAIAQGLPPLSDPSHKWGRKFADTSPTAVTMPDGLCEMLAIITFVTLGPEHKDIDDPAQIIEVGNRFAGAGCPELLKQLSNPDLRITALDKVLGFAASLHSGLHAIGEGKQPSDQLSDLAKQEGFVSPRIDNRTARRLDAVLGEIGNSRAAQAARLRCGLVDGRSRSWWEIGQELGVAESEAMRMVKAAIAQVRDGEF